MEKQRFYSDRFYQGYYISLYARARVSSLLIRPSRVIIGNLLGRTVKIRPTAARKYQKSQLVYDIIR